MSIDYILLPLVFALFSLIYFKMTSSNREEWRNLSSVHTLIISLLIGIFLSSVITIFYYLFLKEWSLVLALGSLLLSILNGFLFSLINDHLIKKIELPKEINKDAAKTNKINKLNEDIERIKKEMKSFKMLR